jgi:hypothetical protein
MVGVKIDSLFYSVAEIFSAAGHARKKREMEKEFF